MTLFAAYDILTGLYWSGEEFDVHPMHDDEVCALLTEEQFLALAKTRENVGYLAVDFPVLQT